MKVYKKIEEGYSYEKTIQQMRIAKWCYYKNGNSVVAIANTLRLSTGRIYQYLSIKEPDTNLKGINVSD